MQIVFVGNQVDVRITLDEQTDEANNRTTLRLTEFAVRATRGAVGSGYVTGNITIDGKTLVNMTYQSLGSVGIILQPEWYARPPEAWGSLVFQKSDVVVEHDADGTKSIKVEASLQVRYNTGGEVDSVKKSQETALQQIDKESSLSVEGVTLGQQMKITISKPSASTKVNVKWECGTQKGTIASATTNSSVTFTPAITLASQEPNKTSVAVTITVETLSSAGTVMSTTSKTVQCAIPASVVPTISNVRITDPTGNYDRNAAWLQNASQAKIETTAAGSYGSTIKTYTVRSSDGLISSGTVNTVTMALAKSGTITFTVTVTDSRGRTAQTSKSIVVSTFIAPKVEIINAYRCDSAGKKNLEGQYMKMEFSYEFQNVAGNTYSVYAVWEANGTRSERKLTQYTAAKATGSVILDASSTTGFKCWIRIEDKYSVVESTKSVIPEAFALLDFWKEKSAVGVGMRANAEMTFCIGLKTDMNENRIINLGLPSANGDAATKKYVDDAIAALRRDLGL